MLAARAERALGVVAQILPAPEVPTPGGTPTIEWSAVLPFLVLGLGGVLLLTFASLSRRSSSPTRFLGAYSAFTVTVGIAALLASARLWARVQGWADLAWDEGEPTGPFSAIGGAVGIDGFGIELLMLISVCVVLAALLLDDYLRREDLDGPEMYALLLFSALGAGIMATANDLIVLFLGLETLSIAVYVMAALHLRRVQSQEAGFKYFVLGALSSAFFLYGVAMVYGATGTTNLVMVREFLSDNILRSDALLLVGLALMLVGLGFKVAAVPFHSWSPDVYEGAPTPVVAWMASGVKAAGFAALVRVYFLGFAPLRLDWQPIVYVLAVATLVVGATMAVLQTNVKRMLAYSSVSHAGFLLVGLQAASPEGVAALLFYLIAYAFMVVGSFGVLTVVARQGDARTSLNDLRGLGRSNPGLALVFTVFLFSQAGMPLTGGFIAKFTVVQAAIEARSFWLAIVAMLSAVIAAYLYLRIIVAMYMVDDGDGEGAPTKLPVPFGVAVAVGISLAATIGLGVLPQAVLDDVRHATPALVKFGEPTP